MRHEGESSSGSAVDTTLGCPSLPGLVPPPAPPEMAEMAVAIRCEALELAVAIRCEALDTMICIIIALATKTGQEATGGLLQGGEPDVEIVPDST